MWLAINTGILVNGIVKWWHLGGILRVVHFKTDLL